MFILVPLVFVSVFSMVNDPKLFPKDTTPLVFLFPFGLFLIFAVSYGWSLASLPYRITATSDQLLQFKSLLNVRDVRVPDLISIEPQALRIKVNVSGYLLKHRDGKILFPGQFTGFYILLAELKAANPSFDIRGC